MLDFHTIKTNLVDRKLGQKKMASFLCRDSGKISINEDWKPDKKQSKKVEEFNEGAEESEESKENKKRYGFSKERSESWVNFTRNRRKIFLQIGKPVKTVKNEK